MGYWKLKGCPKCGGDIFVDREDTSCLQCGCGHLVEYIGKTSIKEKGAVELTKQDRDCEIRILHPEVSQKELALKFHLSQTMISRILRGER